ncbi:disease resistance protein RPP13-like [Gastrolobium bilobum]|uniref:disease resistance protein RPP13-like n=1 Tax=Gastrolobium bilobum TaxID=150636 RepID=UPI002AB0C8C4|nr:disease resistance protein RPP13-like [Gastrolobium bilobum]
MAESVVPFLLEKLSQLLEHEAKLLLGVEGKIKSLHTELQFINAYLKTFDGNKKSKTEIEQEFVNQIRDVSHEAEDVIDTYIANITIHKRRSMLTRMLCGLGNAKLLHEVAEKIENITTTLNNISDNKIKYNFEKSDDQSTLREEEERAQLVHKRRRDVEEEDVVGFVHASEVIIKRLMEEGGSRRNIVPIIGMGGLGKTTLARKVYKSNEVKQYFDCSVWVYVSNEYRAKELLVGLFKQLTLNPEYERRSNKKGKKHKEIDKPQDFSILSTDELKIIVRECLKGKKYLLVLDDLWKTQDWDEVQDAFPDENTGSKILITSRLKEVASHTSQDPPHELQFLNDEESWELFSKKVFRGEEYPTDLESLGKQIVQSCGGLPLSIVVLAGLLANKEKSHREWSKVVGHVNWYLTRDETQVKDIVLKLSYDNLPTRLKTRFLYLGIFPEDFEIHVRPLLEKWVAEGFIRETGTRDPDDVAEDYLYELIDRSLVQVARVKSSGGVKTCRIHDLLRDLCISESKKDKVFEVCTDYNIVIPTKPRRLAIHCSMSRYISSSNNDQSCVRSLFCFDRDLQLTRGLCEWLFKSFKLVQVLELAGRCRMKIPSNLGNFIHLRFPQLKVFQMRYLYVQNWKLANGAMPCLQNLVIESCPELNDLPNELWSLTALRKVQVREPSEAMAHMLRNLKMKGGCELIVEG